MRKKKQFRGWKKLLTLLCAAAVLGTMVPGTIFSAYGSEAEETDQASDVSENSEPKSAEPEGNTEADQTENGSGQEEKQPEQAQDAQPESGEKDTESGADAKDAATEQTQGNTSGKAADSKKDTKTGNTDSVEDAQETEDEASSDLMRKILENIKEIKLLGAEEEEAETFKATFTDEKSLITLDPASVEVKDGNTIPASKFPDTTTEKGYFQDGDEYWFFDGWYNGTDEYTNDTVITSDVTLKAEWVRGYKITFHADTEDIDGKFTEESGDPASVDVVIKDGDVIQRPSEPTVEGYDLDYWYTSNSDPDGSKIAFSSTTGKSDVSVKNENYGTFKDIYVKWIKLHKVTFQVNYTGGTDVTKDKVRNGSTVTASDIKRDGYTAQWFSDESCSSGTEADFSKKITEDTTFYAKWTANEYKILFDGNGGTGTVADLDAVYDDDVTMPANAFEKTGYTFEGWNTKADGTGSSYNAEKTYEAGEANLTTQNDAKVTLYAQWKPISYTVQFNRNDKAGAENFEKETELTCTYDSSETVIPDFETTRSGYQFAAWCDKADGSGKKYNKGDVLLNLTDQNDDTVVLYALWEDLESPRITYKATASTDAAITNKNTSIDYGKTTITYHVTLEDSGTGVNIDSLRYTISESTSAEPYSVEDSAWRKPMGVTPVEDAANAYSFDVKVPGKGILLIKVADNANNESIAKENYAIPAKAENVSDITYARTLVIEEEKPDIDIVIDNGESTADTPENQHTYDISITEKPKTGYSGLNKVEWKLHKGSVDGDVVEAYSGSKQYDSAKDISGLQSSFKLENQVIAENEELKMEGSYYLEVIATDNCGNVSTENKQIVFDNTAPDITVKANKKAEPVGGIYYYKADNCGLTVTIGKDSDFAYLDTSGTSITLRNGTKTKTYPAESSDLKSSMLEVSIAESDIVDEFGDGEITVEVTAKDLAGNTSTLASENVTVEVDGLAQKKDTATFVLDTEAPLLSLSMDGGNYVKDTKTYYYNADNCGIAYSATSKDAPIRDAIISVKGTTALTHEKNSSEDTFTDNAFKSDDIKEIGDGIIEVTMEATDEAGNTSTLATTDDGTVTVGKLNWTKGADKATFVLDTAAPKIELSTLEKGNVGADDGIYYYRADNCGLQFKVGEDTDAAELDLNKTKFTMSGVKDKKIEERPDGKAVSFGKELNKEIVAETFDDGEISITIQAVDYAGNENNLSTLAESDMQMNKKDAVASFILDKTNPVLVKGITEEPANQRYNDNGELKADNENAYDETDFYYNAGTVNVVYEIKDDYLGLIAAGTNEPEKTYDNSQVSEGKITGYRETVTVELKDEGKYTGFFVEGEDKAGNKLEVDVESYNKNSGNGVVNDIEAGADDNGKVVLKYNKIIDRKAPVATITHESPATAYMYGNEAYISGEIKTQISIQDPKKKGEPETWPLDGTKLYYGRILQAGEEHDAEQGKAGDSAIDESYTDSADGHYKYVVFGTDRAGNPVAVKETLSNRTKPNGEKVIDTEEEVGGNGTSYTPRYELIIDRTNPTYTLDMTEVVDASKNVDGTTAYYNKGFTGTFTIDETNFDESRIGAKVQKDNESKYYSQSKAYWENFNGGLNFTENQRYSLSVAAAKDHNTDGVYRFAIQGCDRAGNPLVQSKIEKEKSGYQATVEKDAGKGQFWTNKKVFDTIAPEFNLTIQNGSKKYYDLTKGPAGTVFDEKIYDPFRSETNATVTFKGEDLSPLNITYGITSTVNSQKRNVTDANTFTDARKLTESMKGEQVFLPQNIVVTDRAGNATKLDNANKIYLDVTPPKQDVTAPVATVKASTSITRRSADGRGLYNKSVTLQVNVKDPNPATSSSGLREVTYQVLADGRDVTSQAVVSDAKKTKAGTLVFFSNSSNLPKAVGKNPSLTTDHNFTITLPSGNGKDGTFETNNIRVIVQAVDNAGNKSDSNQGGTVNLGIDTIGPQITVSYDNNSAQNAKYFKNVRYATVRTKERNVDNGKISINTQVGVPGSWSYSAGSDPDGNDDIWTKTLGYTRDGDYTLNISGTDALGNRATVTYTGVAPQAFTIDRTAPVITVTFDNNSAQNGKYYKANRTATVSINEHNFRASDVKISQSATAPRGGSMSSPGASGFSSSGDRRSASIAYTQDGNYRFDVNYTDLAGNPAQAVTVSEFVIDKTAPTLKIENVKENMAYSGEIAPRVVFDDANFSSRLISFLFSGTRVQDHSDLVPSFRSNGAFGGVYDIGNIAVIRKNDDVYTAKATITDLAGNSAEAEITFSVNRFGSTYDYNDDKTTERLMDTYYTNQEKNLIIREINVNALKSHKVTLYRDGSNKVLKEGTDYKVTVGSYGGARQYVYEIFASNFEQEGNYSIIVQSEDEAGNKNTSSTIREDNNVVSALPVEFAVDKTLPEIRAKGASLDSITRYYESGVTIYIIPDDNMSLSRVVLVLDGEVIGEYSGKELQKLLEENDGRIPCEIASKASTQILEVTSYDAAGNESGVQTYKVLVTRNILAQFFNRKPLFFGVIAAVVVLLALLYARRKKKSEESEDAAA